MTGDCRSVHMHTNWVVRPLPENPNLIKPDAPKKWVAYGGSYAAPEITNQGGIVTITGMIKGGDYGLLMKLPKGFEPPQNLSFNVVNAGKPVRINVYPSGEMYWVAGSRAQGWLSLSGISYSVKKGKPIAPQSPWKAEGGDWGAPTYTKVGNLVSLRKLAKIT